MKIIRQRTSTYIPHYLLMFTYDVNSLRTFECDKDGKVDVSKLTPEQLESYNECKTGYVVGSPRRQLRECGKDEDGYDKYEYAPGCSQRVTYKVTDVDVRDYGKWDRQCAIGECVCGAEVHLHGFTNTCDKCERDYNMSGQLLAHRSQWGEETGESLSDILSI